MRRSKKEVIITAALEVIADDGMEALTFDSVASRAGLTRGGVVYHFPTREDLISGIAEDLLSRWTAELHAALGRPVTQSTRAQRIRALVHSALEGSVLTGELVFVVSGRPEADRLNRRWEEVLREWVGHPDTLAPAQRIALLALDGWWTERGLGGSPAWGMDEPTRDLLERMACGCQE